MKFFAANIASSHSKPTITGAEVKFTDFSGLKVNDSGVQARNIEASNGVIHALDTVLTPKPAKLPIAATPDAGAKAKLDAAAASK